MTHSCLSLQIKSNKVKQKQIKTVELLAYTLQALEEVDLRQLITNLVKLLLNITHLCTLQETDLRLLILTQCLILDRLTLMNSYLSKVWEVNLALQIILVWE